MSLIPTITERLARARADLRMGVPVVFQNGDTKILAIAAETLSAERLFAMRDIADPVLVITGRRAETLKARVYDGDLARVLIPSDATVSWVRQIADPADDLNTPMKGPLASERSGDVSLHRAAIQLAKAARLLPAMVAIDVKDAPVDLTCVDLESAQDALRDLSPLASVISARVPLAVSKAGRLHVFRPDNGGEEHYAVEIGKPMRDQPVLARLHSACFTGDLLGSLKCDCGPQLNGALAQMGHEGAGVLLYLNQEGRGIGLANKMRAYSLQDQGFDTVEANHRLGFEDDERDFRIGADILRRLGFKSVRLLTNNPAKVAMLTDCGLDVVERVPLKVGENPLNAQYLKTKAQKSGHLL